MDTCWQRRRQLTSELPRFSSQKKKVKEAARIGWVTYPQQVHNIILLNYRFKLINKKHGRDFEALVIINSPTWSASISKDLERHATPTS